MLPRSLAPRAPSASITSAAGSSAVFSRPKHGADGHAHGTDGHAATTDDDGSPGLNRPGHQRKDIPTGAPETPFMVEYGLYVYVQARSVRNDVAALNGARAVRRAPGVTLSAVRRKKSDVAQGSLIPFAGGVSGVSLYDGAQKER